jgi:hypothetical protein
LYEGWDFFAEDCRYLLLTFKVNRNANISGMMHRAVRLIHYLREGMLRGASSWEPLLERKEDLVGNLPVSLDGPRLAFTLPPHAVAFITLLQHQDMAGPFRGSGTIGWWKGLARPEMIEKALRGLPGSDG